MYLLNHLIDGVFCIPFTKGLIVLLGSGVHTVWAFWEIYSGTADVFEQEVIITVGSWYIATIIGSAIATVLIPKWSKKRIYVSF